MTPVSGAPAAPRAGRVCVGGTHKVYMVWVRGRGARGAGMLPGVP